MEKLFDFINLLLFAALILGPVFILRKLYRRELRYFLLAFVSISLAASLVIMVLFVWWSDVSNIILLRYYGFDGLNDVERFLNVSAENIDRVNEIVVVGQYGIGWTLKAIFTYAWFLPYLLIIYGIDDFRRTLITLKSKT